MYIFYLGFKKIKSEIKNLYFEYQRKRDIIYRIIMIDPKKQNAILQIKDKNVIFKSNVIQILYDANILKGLAPKDASHLGIVYGKILKKVSDNKSFLKNDRMMNLLQNNNGKYRILYERRDKKIGYVNIISNDVYIESPLEIANNKEVINQFNPSQACYIGILAGIMLEKSKYKKLNSIIQTDNNQPNLKIVK